MASVTFGSYSAFVASSCDRFIWKVLWKEMEMTMVSATLRDFKWSSLWELMVNIFEREEHHPSLYHLFPIYFFVIDSKKAITMYTCKVMVNTFYK